MDDLISKLSEIRSEYNCFDEDEEPQYRALSEAIRILSQLADGDTISRQAAIDVLEERLQANGYSNVALVSEFNRSIGYLMRLPSAQPERKKGEWLRYGEDGYPNNEDTVFWQCDQCLEQYTGRTKRIPNFCPNCGADMREENHEQA